MKNSASARPLVIAHRGASGYRPEHSLAAYDLALDLGADAVEPDIVATKDGILVLRHENEISGTTDVAAHPEFADRRTSKVIDGQKLTGWFTEDFTWQELRTLRVRERLPKLRSRAFDGEEGILRLTDLLDLLDDRGGAGMVAEIKHATYFESIGLPLDELFAAELSSAGWSSDPRLTVECFETTVLGRIRNRGVQAKYVFLLEAAGAPADQVAAHGSAAQPFSAYLTDGGLVALAASGLQGISVDKRMLLELDKAGNATGTTDLVQRAHAAGLDVYCWTLRAENQFLAKNLRRGVNARDYGDWLGEFQLLMRTGLDGVFSDQADLAIEARAAL
ncbi:glycerophosphoryl diester phosphodiesterase [Cryobacterium mesophilum]|uniref:glycerophosphodiester phosphodiesterase family protein n=1 Tax=Terrimesophilobacter mesophilus TaxID=433647 RepID=UPI00180690BE|nr:glycerophosphodiester phosphodiesterase family protein [Terrimesophilobacter mesophilus]MBB5632861.1 glycerophosphoryl diester phosphodiesterase [Terrimesophilobacter mesophilus]